MLLKLWMIILLVTLPQLYCTLLLLKPIFSFFIMCTASSTGTAVIFFLKVSLYLFFITFKKQIQWTKRQRLIILPSSDSTRGWCSAWIIVAHTYCCWRKLGGLLSRVLWSTGLCCSTCLSGMFLYMSRTRSGIFWPNESGYCRLVGETLFSWVF